jgi:hypothetical protein
MVPFGHFSADGLPIDSTITTERIKKFVDVDNVTIAFDDASGLDLAEMRSRRANSLTQRNR